MKLHVGLPYTLRTNKQLVSFSAHINEMFSARSYIIVLSEMNDTLCVQGYYRIQNSAEM